ncbi:hypothetical protein Tco_1138278, partial [Tanacetum coccineum]
MDDSKLTMEEYIELEAEKARRHGQRFNWEIATYGKNRYRKDINYFKDFETDFLVIIFDDPLGPDHKISSEPTFILALGLHTAEEMAGDGFLAYWVGSLRKIATKGDLSSYWSRITSDGDFSETDPSYTSSRDPLRRLCHRLITVSISGRGQAHEKGRKRRARMSGKNFVRRLAEHFGLVTKEGLRGLTVVVGELRVIDIDELVRDGWSSITAARCEWGDLSEVCSFMLCDLDFEPLTLSLTSIPSCDLVSFTNILILCLILKASNQSLR